jgi:hypothetical protein
MNPSNPIYVQMKLLDSANTVSVFKLDMRDSKLVVGDPTQQTLNKLKLSQEKNNQNRMLEINTYYGKKQSAQNSILYTIWFTIILIWIVWYIGQYFTAIPEWAVSITLILLISICIIIIIFKVNDMQNRNNHNYDQYDVDVKNLPPIAQNINGNGGGVSNSNDSLLTGSSSGCQNQNCCPKFFTFSQRLGYCSLNPFG